MTSRTEDLAARAYRTGGHDGAVMALVKSGSPCATAELIAAIIAESKKNAK